MKEPWCQPFPIQPLEEGGRDDLIRVHVVCGERGNSPRHPGEGLHGATSLGSVTNPVMAVAAAVSGLPRKVRPPGP